MGTRCIYNGVDLGLVKTTGYTEDPAKDSSGTDLLFTNVTISIESIVSILDNGGIPSHVPGETTPSEIYARLEHLLSRPRRPFLYAVANEALVDIPTGHDITSTAEALDANNGPWPKVDIIQVTDSTFRIAFKIVCAVADCNGVRQRFASNRWDMAHDIDAKGFSSLTTTGELIVRSDMRLNPDQLRGLCAPPLQNDFVRETSFQLSRDGLKLQYRFKDVQRYILPPDGCTVIDGDTAISGGVEGGMVMGTVRVILEGLKGEKKRDLMATACLMCLRKLESLRPIPRPGGTGFQIQNCAWREWHSENRVEVVLSTLVLRSSVVAGADDQRSKAEAFGEGFGDSIFPTIDIDKELDRVLDGESERTADLKAKTDALQQKLREKEQARKSGATAAVEYPLGERFGDDLVFTGQDVPGMDPGIRGNVPFLEMVAAAFRDPCTQDALKRQAFKPVGGPKVVQLGNKPVGGGGDTVIAGVAAAAAKAIIEGVTPLLMQNLSYSRDQEEDIAAGILAVRNERVARRTNRLRTFAVVDNLTLMTDDIGRAGADPYPGLYTNWMCTVKVSKLMNQDVCERTVGGLPGVRIRWANPGKRLTVVWEGEKYGGPVEYPAVVDDNLVCTAFEVATEDCGLAADGVTLIYRASGISVYKALDPSLVNPLAVIPPWIGASMYQVGTVPRLIGSTTGIRTLTSGGGFFATSMTSASGGSRRLTNVPGVLPVNA